MCSSDPAIVRLRRENEILHEQVAALTSAWKEDPLDGLIAKTRLGPSERIIVAMLMRRQVARREAIHDALYALRPDDPPSPKIIDVWIWRLRRKLRPHGYEIRNVWGTGWTLERPQDP